MADEPVKLTREEARGGTNPGAMRYVLGVSVVLVIVAFVVIYFVWG